MQSPIEELNERNPLPNFGTRSRPGITLSDQVTISLCSRVRPELEMLEVAAGGDEVNFMLLEKWGRKITECRHPCFTGHELASIGISSTIVNLHGGRLLAGHEGSLKPPSLRTPKLSANISTIDDQRFSFTGVKKSPLSGKIPSLFKDREPLSISSMSPAPWRP